MDDLAEKRTLYPRVSDIISKQNVDELRNVPIETLANACIRGTKVHDYCTAWMKNLWVSDIEKEYQPYFDAFTKWASENVKCSLHTGIRLYDDVKRFTGEFDMIVQMADDRIVLLDIKTSASKSKAWPIQLAAYDHLCKINGYKFDGVLNLHLKKVRAAAFEEKEEEKVQVSPPHIKACTVWYEDISPYWEIFASSLKCYDYFDRKEVK